VLLLLADDHSLVREGLKHTLAGLSPQVEFVEAATAEGVIAALTGNAGIELLLLDLIMPGSNGFGLLKRVCDDYPELPVVILSGSSDPAQMRKALDIGASGYVTKSATAGVMLSALRLVLAGGIYVPPDMLKPEASSTAGKTPLAEVRSTQPVTATASLTTRQREVLACLGQGKSNKVIARELGLSENTVKIHVAAILRALGVDNRTQAALVMQEQGIDSPSEH
jgi:DNA-binding NarL/FixJ family response regulator